MESNKRLYVFDKKEVLLIFILVLLISTTCFVFGVKIGKSYSLDTQGVLPTDIERVDLLSQKEEKIQEDEKLLEKMVEEADKNLPRPVENDSGATIDLLKQKIDSEVLEKRSENTQASTELKKKATSEKLIESSTATSQQTSAKSISGKWTIQLGSHQNNEDAEAFADGFRVRGYDPIINQVYLGDRGVWFRVSLGLFSSIIEAKNYVVEHQTLFDGQDYVFIQFD